MCVVWTGCGQRTVHTTHKHGMVADMTIMELWPCLTLSHVVAFKEGCSACSRLILTMRIIVTSTSYRFKVPRNVLWGVQGRSGNTEDLLDYKPMKR